MDRDEKALKDFQAARVQDGNSQVCYVCEKNQNHLQGMGLTYMESH